MVCSVKVGTPDALLGFIWGAADGIRSSQRNLQRATRAVHNLAAKNAFLQGVALSKNYLENSSAS